MVEVFKDGFDKYGPPGQFSPSDDSLVAFEWSFVGQINIIDGLSSFGQAMQMISGQTVNKNLPTNYPRLIVGARVRLDSFAGAGADTGIFEFQDGGTSQVSLACSNTGVLRVRTGNLSTLLAQAAPATAISVTDVHYIEFDVTFAAAGAYQVWLDGVSIISGTGNTKVSVNNFANILTLFSNTGATTVYDDLYLFDATGTTNNAALLTSPIIETLIATADHQTQFTYVSNTLGKANSASSATPTSPGANELVLHRIIAPVNCTLNSVSFFPMTTSITAKFKAVVYTDVGGTAAGGTLLSSGVEVVGVVASTVATGNLVTPQNLVAGTAYWVGYIIDTSITLQIIDALSSGQRAANTYTSGAPATAPAMTATVTWEIWGNASGAVNNNWSAETNFAGITDVSYVASSTVGNKDLYAFSSLQGSPTNIYSTTIKALAKRTDTGARTMSLHLLSGASDSVGDNSGITPGTNYNWIDSGFNVDPATGVAWTNTGIANLFAGPAIAS